MTWDDSELPASIPLGSERGGNGFKVRKERKGGVEFSRGRLKTEKNKIRVKKKRIEEN